MLIHPTLFIAVAGTAFLAASYAPGLFASEATAGSVRPVASVSGKSDRLSAPQPSPAGRKAVTIVEIVGSTQPTVVLRGRDGSILYRSDAPTGTTLVVKDADLPLVTVRQVQDGEPGTSSPARPEPTAREESREPPAGPRTRTIGCETALSPLARGAASAGLSRCLAEAAPPRVSS